MILFTKNLIIICFLFYFTQRLYGAETSSVRFHVFTKNNENVSFDLKNIRYSLNKTCSPTKLLHKFIVHGFAERWNMNWRWNWVESLIKELNNSLEAPNLCLIAVDWEELAKGGLLIANYWKAIDNMKIAAEIMVNYLKENRINEKNMHCIGFSLGAHMCSIFYKTYYEKIKIKPERITGLDPAGPFYEKKPFTEKLHYTDANFVDIIHSSENFGLIEKNGHMDFYPDLGPSE